MAHIQNASKADHGKGRIEPSELKLITYSVCIFILGFSESAIEFRRIWKHI
mgnify:CR=1 FL=1